MKIKNIFSLFIACIFIVSNSFAKKINYEKFRTSLPNYICGRSTVKKIEDEYKFFSHLDSSKISKKDLFLYYKDYGASCADKATVVQDVSKIEKDLFLEKSSYYYAKAVSIDSTDVQLLWNYTFGLAYQNQCAAANKYLALFTKYQIKEGLAPKADILKEVEELKSGCGTY